MKQYLSTFGHVISVQFSKLRLGFDQFADRLNAVLHPMALMLGVERGRMLCGE